MISAKLRKKKKYSLKNTPPKISRPPSSLISWADMAKCQQSPDETRKKKKPFQFVTPLQILPADTRNQTKLYILYICLSFVFRHLLMKFPDIQFQMLELLIHSWKCLRRHRTSTQIWSISFFKASFSSGFAEQNLVIIIYIFTIFNNLETLDRLSFFHQFGKQFALFEDPYLED